MRVVLAVFAVLALASCGAPSSTTTETATSAPQTSGGIELRDAWISPTPAGATVSAGYVVIVNTGEADRLIGVSTPRAQMAEVHRMDMQNGMMEMRSAGPLDIPAGGTVTLAPGGLHLMLMGVTTPFTEGETVPVTLRFEHAGDKELAVPVRRGATSH